MSILLFTSVVLVTATVTAFHMNLGTNGYENADQQIERDQ